MRGCEGEWDRRLGRGCTRELTSIERNFSFSVGCLPAHTVMICWQEAPLAYNLSCTLWLRPSGEFTPNYNRHFAGAESYISRPHQLQTPPVSTRNSFFFLDRNIALIPLQVVEACTLVLSLARLTMGQKDRPREERAKLRAHCLTALRMRGGSHLAQHHVGQARKDARYIYMSVDHASAENLEVPSPLRFAPSVA